jgi:hypothetical protein
MPEELVICVHTGRTANEDGGCPEHDATEDCLFSVMLEALVHECVIPGFQCTHDHHIRPIRRWPPIPDQRQRS